MNTSMKLALLVVAAICMQQTSGTPILPQQISGNSIAQQIAQELQQAANNAKIGLENAEHSIVLTSESGAAADTPKVVESISSIEQQIGNSASGQQIARELQQAANNAKIGLENAEHSIVLVADTGATAGASESVSSIEQQIISSPFGQQIAGELQQAGNNAKIGLQNAEHSVVLEGTPNVVPSTVNLVPHVIVGGIKVASAAAGDVGQVVHSAISAEDHVAAAGAQVGVLGIQGATNVVPAVIQGGIKIATAGAGDLGRVLQTGANGMAHILSGIFFIYVYEENDTRTTQKHLLQSVFFPRPHFSSKNTSISNARTRDENMLTRPTAPSSLSSSAAAGAVVTSDLSVLPSLVEQRQHQPYWHRGIKAFFLCIIVSVAASACVTQCDAEYYSSVDSLQWLNIIEVELVRAFRHYLELQEREFANYRKFIEHVKLQHSVALEDIEDYLGNPINAFTLIKRMVTDWNNLHTLLKESEVRKEFRKALENLNKEVEFPDDNDLRGAVKGLARLQETYKLNATDLAFGMLNGVYYGSELSWHDCFEIATNLFDEKELSLAITWFELTHLLLKIEEKDVTNTQKFQFDILEYMALANYELGNIDKANAYIDEILETDPEHTAKEIKSYMRLSALRGTQITDISTKFDWHFNYTRLCQGIQVPEAVHHKLRCILEKKNSYYFYLAPLRIEELSVDPPVLLYHNLLNNDQIEEILEKAEDNMTRSLVHNYTSGLPIVQNVRVSQQAWLDFTSPLMQSIRNLVSDISGLDLGNAENMQVANYGIGGQYEPHNDFFGKEKPLDPRWIGDRISTSMFYFSDVEQGGYTVFPKLNVYSRPVKGALVMWYNLHKSLDVDFRFLHAGCPVLKGSKRIGNIWTHSGLQEFRRPCEEQRDNFKSQAYS